MAKMMPFLSTLPAKKTSLNKVSIFVARTERSFAFVEFHSLGNQPTFCDATPVLPTKGRLGNYCRNSILSVCHHPDLGSISDWLKQMRRHSFPKRHFAGKQSINQSTLFIT